MPGLTTRAERAGLSRDGVDGADDLAGILRNVEVGLPDGLGEEIEEGDGGSDSVMD